MGKYILSLDQGTTSSRAIIFNKNGEIVTSSQKELTQIYPKSGWVEQDPMEIWATQSGVVREALERSSISPQDIAGIGITNQRETTILWDKNTGKPIYNAIVWQCRRTAKICYELESKGLSDYIQENTGLIIDAYFSATKIKWILDNVKGAREKAKKCEILFGNVDTWLVWNLTRGKVHATDYTNASRTMLFNIKTLEWDKFLLKELDIPKEILPEVKSSDGSFGYTDEKSFGAKIPISGILGDQQAALFGQKCLTEGMAKNTYGTGCFMLMNTGNNIIKSNNKLLTTIAWGFEDKVFYALEGSIFIGGALIQWLRDELKLIDRSEDSEYFANKVDDNGGVYVVPAFVGLGAPYWDMYARGAILGLTRGSNRNHIIRASLEAIAYQTKDVLKAMEDDSNVKLKTLKVDGGASANEFLMQFQADILNTEVIRPSNLESTALGTAYMAGLSVGFWKDIEEIYGLENKSSTYKPRMTDIKRNVLYKGWLKAVARSYNWEEEEKI